MSAELESGQAEGTDSSPASRLSHHVVVEVLSERSKAEAPGLLCALAASGRRLLLGLP